MELFYSQMQGLDTLNPVMIINNKLKLVCHKLLPFFPRNSIYDLQSPQFNYYQKKVKPLFKLQLRSTWKFHCSNSSDFLLTMCRKWLYTRLKQFMLSSIILEKIFLYKLLIDLTVLYTFLNTVTQKLFEMTILYERTCRKWKQNSEAEWKN